MGEPCCKGGKHLVVYQEGDTGGSPLSPPCVAGGASQHAPTLRSVLLGAGFRGGCAVLEESVRDTGMPAGSALAATPGQGGWFRKGTLGPGGGPGAGCACISWDPALGAPCQTQIVTPDACVVPVGCWVYWKDLPVKHWWGCESPSRWGGTHAPRKSAGPRPPWGAQISSR